MKKMIAFLLSLYLFLQPLTPAWACQEASDENGTTPMSESVIESAADVPDGAPVLPVGTRAFSQQYNPLYGERETAPTHSITRPHYYAAAAFDPDDFYTEDADVLEAIASGMEQRKTVITVPWRIPLSAVSTYDDVFALEFAALTLAMSHTGEPTRGDSLLLCYDYLQYGFEIVSYDDNYYYINFIFDEIIYHTTAAQEAALTAKLTEVMASFGFTEETDDYTKIKTIYDYVCANITYDYDNLEDESYLLKFSAYAALVNGTAVCQGYALLMYRMLLMAGVDTRVITGESLGGGHAWNIVQLNNFYYNLDSTWDAGYTEYDWFLKCPANFPDHTRDAAYDSADFHTLYPMASVDYVPGENPIVAEGTCGEGVSWVLGTDGILTVSGTGTMDDYSKTYHAPWYNYRDHILAVEIQSGVTHVGAYSFDQCSILQVVSVAGAQTIGQNAFSNCPSLLAADILEGTEEIGQSAFHNGKMLAAVSMPASLKRLAPNAFSSCPAMEAVLLADIAAWCTVSFANNTSNPFHSGASLYLNEELVAELVIPEGVSTISDYAFAGAKITSLVISEGTEEIGELAFSGCQHMVSVSMPASIKRIGANAFNHPPALEAVMLADVAAWCSVSFADKNSTPFHSGAALYVNGEPVSELVIPAGVSAVNDYAFYGANITSLATPEALKQVGSYAFYDSALTSAVLAEGLLVIGDYAFSETALKEVHIPASLQVIGDGAFPYIAEGIKMHISDVAAWCAMEIGGESAMGYRTVLYMDGQPVTELQIPEGVVALKPYAFRHIANEMTVNLPSTLERIEREAFAYSGIQSITIPDSVVSIAYMAFGGSAVESVSVGNGIENIDHYAFYECRKLKSIAFGTGLQELSYSVLENCSSLTSLTLPDSITTIAKYALAGCSALESLTLPKNLQTVGDYALQNCSSLTSVTFPSALTRLGFMAFSGCSALTKVSFAGDPPVFDTRCFSNITATVYYPLNNDSWTENVRQNYGGNLTWTAACTNHTEIIFPAVAPTCAESGLTEGSCCPSCGEIFAVQEVIPATGHTEVIDEGAKPTCTKPGLTQGSHCSVCGEILIEQQQTPMYGHRWDDGVVIVPPTDSTDGQRTYTCTVCGETMTEAIPSLVYINVSARLLYLNEHDEYDQLRLETQLPRGSTYQDLYDLIEFPAASEHTSSLGELVGWKASFDSDSLSDPIVTFPHTTLGLTAEYEYTRAQCTFYYVDEKGEVASRSEKMRLPTGSSPAPLFENVTIPDCDSLFRHWYVEDASDAFDVTLSAYACYDDKVPAQVTIYYLNAEGKKTRTTPHFYLELDPETATKEEIKAAITQAIAELDGLVPAGQQISGYTWMQTSFSHSVSESDDFGQVCSACSAVVTLEYEGICGGSHVEAIDAAVAPTCTKSGLTEGSHCALCGEVLIAQKVIPATGHSFADGTCQNCGEMEPNSDFTVETAGNITYTVKENIITVTHDVACKVGYLADGAYVKISAKSNPDGSYRFEVPAAADEVLIVVAGDVNGNGRLDTGDKARLNAALLKKTTLDAKASFAADVTNDGKLLAVDKSRLNAVLLKKATLSWWK